MPTTTRYCKPGSTMSYIDPATGKLVTVTYDKLGATYSLWVPGDDLAFMVTADGMAPVAPAPAPTDTMPTPPQGTTVQRLPATTNATLQLKSNTWYAPAVGQTRATVHANVGCRIPSGTINVKVFNVDFVGNGDVGHGIDGTGTTGIRDVEFNGGSCRNFTNGCSIHGKNIEGPSVHQGVTFRNWQMMDTGGDKSNEGQGFYLANIDGLTIQNCFGDKNGLPPIGPETHFAYIAAGNRNVTVKDNFVAHAEAVGVQARGPLVSYTDPDDGKDPGPQITGNVFYDCAIGVMVNGPRATVRDNLIFVGHHSKVTNNTGGECGVYGSVGQLRETGNVLCHSPVHDTGTVLPPWTNNPRQDYAVDGSGNKFPWGWNRPCVYAENTGNVARKDVTVDLSDLVTRGRNGEGVAGLIAEARQRVKAAGV